jgi:two-component system, cell cycle sensor histidine kinase and response regulator CckA
MPSVVLVTGLFASVVGYGKLRDYEARQMSARVDAQVANHFSVVQQVVARQEVLLTSLQNLMRHRGGVDRAEFEEATRDLLGLETGWKWIDWAPRVTGGQQGPFEETARSEGLANYRIVEPGPEGQLIPAAARDEYFPTLYVAPYWSGVSALGLDLAADPERRRSLQAARDTMEGQVLLNPPLLRRITDREVVVILLPVYRSGAALKTVDQRRAAFVGCLQAVYDTGELIEGHTMRYPPWGLDWLVLVRAGGREVPAHFHSSRRHASPQTMPRSDELRSGAHHERSLAIAGIELVLLYRPAPALMASSQSLFPASFLVGSLSTTLLASAYLLTLARRRKVVEDEVGRRTAEVRAATRRLKDSEERFRAYMDHSPMVAWLKDHDLRLRYRNAAFRRLFNMKESLEDARLELTDFDYLPKEVAEAVRANDRKVLAEGKPIELIEDVPSPDGRMRCWLVSKFPFAGPDGQMWVGGMAVEITQRLEAERALRESEQRLELAIEGAELGIWDRDLRTGRTARNQQWSAMLGYTPGELTPGKAGWEKLLHPDDKPRALAALEDHLAGRSPRYQAEFRLQTKAGDWKWIQASGRIVERDAAGRPVRIAGTHRDITQRRRSERTRHVLSALGRRLSEAHHAREAAQVILDLAGELFPWDAAYLDRYDARLDQITTLLAFDLIQGMKTEVGAAYEHAPPSPIARQVVEQGPQLVLREDEPADPRCFVPFGNTARPSASLMFAPIRHGGQVIGLLSVQSYTRRAYTQADLEVLQTLADYAGGALERIRAEEALDRERNLLRTLLDSLPDVVFTKNTEGRFVLCNPALLKLVGAKTESEVAGKSASELFSPDDAQAYEADDRSVLGTGQPILNREEPRRDPAGNSSWFLTTKVPLRDAAGNITGLIGISRNIDERRRAEEALRQEHNLLRTLINRLPEDIYIKDRDGAFVLANTASCRRVGLASDAGLVGRTVHDFFPAEVAGRYTADDRQVLDTGEPVLDREEPFITPEGGEGMFRTTKLPLLDAQARIIGLIGISRDITEERRAAREKALMQRQIEETQKLESLGVLAGGIAHDFNNLLTGVLGNASLLKLDLPDNSPLIACVEEIEKASLRAGDLCKQMLAYAGKGRFLIRRLDLSALIEDSRRFLQLSVGRSVGLEFHLMQELPAVSADATQMRQILMNLVINASEAIGNTDGSITVSTGVVQAGRNDLSEAYLAPDLPAGDYVFLEVSDTGCGMDQETQRKIFDPFFTTKFQGRGLGLAAVLGIVRGHKGALKVSSEPGRGTTFRLLLPRVEGEAERFDSVEAAGPAWRGQGTVLVIDDEDTVRATIARMLESFGLDVRTASDGQRGVETFAADPDAIQLVLLDLTMPCMDGVETFRQLRRVRGDVPVLLMSGYNEQEALNRFTDKGLEGFIQKPFSTSTLREKVRAVLDGGEPAGD